MLRHNMIKLITQRSQVEIPTPLLLKMALGPESGGHFQDFALDSVGSDDVARSELGERLVYHLEGRSLLDPAPKHPAPSTRHVEWHSRQVFKDSA